MYKQENNNQYELSDYYSLVYYLVNKYYWQFNYQIKKELFQYGIEGVWFAIKSYNADKGNLTTHISYHVIRECKKYLKDFYKVGEKDIWFYSYDEDVSLQDVNAKDAYGDYCKRKCYINILFDIAYSHCNESQYYILRSFVEAYLNGDCKNFSEAAKVAGVSRQYINRIFHVITSKVTDEEREIILEVLHY